MTEPNFDHDRLDLYNVAIQYVASSFAVAKELKGHHRHARDQSVRPFNLTKHDVGQGEGGQFETISGNDCLVLRRQPVLVLDLGHQ